LVVENAYQWVGSPGLAGLVVYVDGQRAGVAALGSQFMVRIDPGQHTARVRLWWYLSPTVVLTVEPGEIKRFSADIPRQRMIFARIAGGLFDPFPWLSLEEVR
jgi:hypothetical protein